MAPKGKHPKECNVNVSVRVRPRNEEEISRNSPNSVEASTALNQCRVKVKAGTKIDTKTYSFDRVFGPDSTQVEVYRSVVEPVLLEVLQGFNCTVFAYGQTGTGKTHTMEGYRSDKEYKSFIDDPGAGIIPRALHQLFELLEQGDTEFTVRVSFLEIYNEELFDLLSPPNDTSKLRLFEDSARKGSVVIQGLEEVTVHSKEEVYSILKKGAEKRRTSETLMNKSSSRSHSVFSVTIHQKENGVTGEELLKTGKLYLVDLAGSENIGRSGAVKDRAREAGNINQSLLTLGRVISKLVEKAGHIPYRESKLTRLLQDSLGGKTKTSIIATISPAQINLEESLSTLDYAYRAKNITNRPEANQTLTKKALIKEFTGEIERLKRDLQAARDKNGVFLSADTYQTMQTELEAQKTQIEEIQTQLESTIEQREKVEKLFEEKKREHEETTAQLVETEETLKETEETLKVTEQKKRERTFLMKQHAKTEAELSKQAGQLLKVAGTTTSHVAGLHSKLERKTMVEHHNQQTTQQFKQVLTESVTDLMESTQRFFTQHSADFTGVKANIASFVEQRQQQCCQLQAQLSELSSVAASNGASTLAATAQASKEQEAMLQQHADSAKAFAAETSAKHLSFSSSVVATGLEQLQGRISQHEANLQAFQTFVLGFISASNDKLATFAQAQIEGISSLEQLVSTNVSAQVKALEMRNAALEAAVQQQHVTSAQALQTMQEQMGQMLQSFVTKQTEATSASLATMLDATASQSAELKTLHTHHSTACASLQQQVSGHKAVFGQEVAAAQVEVGQQAASFSAELQATAGSMAEFGQQASTHSKEGVQAVQTFEQQTLDTITDCNSHAQAALAAHTDAVSATTQRIESRVVDVDAGVVSLSEQVLTFGQSAQASLMHMGEATSTISAHTDTVLGAIKADTDALVTQRLRVDEPTGATPQRQTYQYPTNLAKTRPHNLLLGDFRSAPPADGDVSFDGSSVDGGLISVTNTPVKAFDGSTPPSPAIGGGKENADAMQSPTTRSKIPQMGSVRRPSALNIVNQ
eukprot:m.32823 g.32823  ORF g.32823 m.32823 type:complete len:1042 (-) comp10167_c0_seq1:14-3139(-)